MTDQASILLQQALALSERERADLACSIMDSLDATVDPDAESAWDQEVGRRVAELDSGAAKTIPWEQVQRRISAKLQDGK